MKNPIRLLIAEDSHFVREALREMIAKESSIKLLAEAKDAEETLRLIEQHKPDVVLLDISMGNPDAGFEVAKKLYEGKSPVKALFFSGQDYSESLLREFVSRALALGAAGFITKAASTAEIIDAIKSVAAGRRYLSGKLSQYLFDLGERAQAFQQQFPNLTMLSEMDLRILLLLAEAKTSKEIAAELELSPRTVENHLNEMRDKLDLKGHHHLMKFAIEHKADLTAVISKKK